MRVRNALLSVPGVRTAEVDFGKREAVVTVDREKLDARALIQAVDKAGYQASVKGGVPPTAGHDR